MFSIFHLQLFMPWKFIFVVHVCEQKKNIENVFYYEGMGFIVME